MPQLLAVYRSQSAEGLALSSLYLEVRPYTLHIMSSAPVLALAPFLRGVSRPCVPMTSC